MRDPLTPAGNPTDATILFPNRYRVKVHLNQGLDLPYDANKYALNKSFSLRVASSTGNPLVSRPWTVRKTLDPKRRDH